MAKYYVESGDLRVVVQATNPIPAAAKALSWATEEDRLGPLVSVNERGFIHKRTGGHARDTDVTIETGTLLALIAEHDFA